MLSTYVPKGTLVRWATINSLEIGVTIGDVMEDNVYSCTERVKVFWIRAKVGGWKGKINYPLLDCLDLIY